MTDEPATVATLAPPPSGGRIVLRRRLFLAATLLTTFVCGAIVGATMVRNFPPEMGHQPPGPNDDPPRRMLNQLQKKLNLDDTQSAEVGRILREHWEQLEEFRREASPRIEASFEKMHADISANLRPHQQVAWDEHFNRMKRGFPPHGRGGPGRHGGPPHGAPPDGSPPHRPPPE